jgi:SAM-dependent methyltransferase
MTSLDEQRAAGAAVFVEASVAASYYARTPYALALFDVLLGEVAGRGRALDIGCGPGKVARVLADHFAEVVALDPSAPMIAAGKAADAGTHANIDWVLTTAEAYEVGAGFDLVTAGASIHWTDPAVVFPKLARWTSVVALLNDAPTFPAPPPPCGHDAWLDFVEPWFGRTGRQIPDAWRAPDPEAWSPLGPHGAWLDIAGRRRFAHTFRQSVEDFVIGNHSRVNWNPRVLGPALSAEFDRELDALMRPFATAGILDIDAACELTWGAPRATPRPS